MFSVFGFLALIVAALGLYSVLAFNVAQRTHEIGVRSALGATRGRIVTQILKESVTLAAIGIMLGLVIAIAAGGALTPLLYEISPRDPLVLIVVTAALLLAAAAAGLVPAWRAARIDPNAALRVE
jgi:ABC-type antimicrobial peptide transport system permease subunit